MKLSRMLQLMIAATCGIILMLMAVCLFAYEWTTMNRTVAEELTAQADMLGSNSRAALLFGDQEAAQKTLQSVSANSQIVRALLFNKSDQLFAVYNHPKFTGRPDFELSQTIVHDKEVIGRIVLVSDMENAYSRLRRYALILSLIFGLAIIIAGIVAHQLQKLISEPIIELNHAAVAISNSNDYTIRVPVPHQRELKELTIAFNHMLSQIESYATKLEESNRNLQDFTHIASHDLQEPLRKIQAFGDRLRDKCAIALGEEGGDYLSRMQNAASRMQELIQGLLDFSRITTKKQPYLQVNLDTVAKEVMSDLEVRIEKTHAEIELVNLPTIDADPLQMRQMIQNLIGNALKFQEPGMTPHIRIEGKLITQEECEITVSDNGIGFDPKYAEKIFAVFQRLNNRSQYEGTGIGLAVVKKIIERHHGTIKATSQLGEGATFVINLPIHQVTV